MKTYLNLGCGNRFHPSWTNIDFVSQSEYVQAHNLLKGIPFENEHFELVYHSHVLEHFSKTDGEAFLKECFRVLKNNGTIRIAVPDLEQIAKEYLQNLSLALQGDISAQQNYEWIMLEMYDQVVRIKSGGDMAAYIFQEQIPNEEYVFRRLGEEARNLRKGYLTSKNQAIVNNPSKDQRSLLRKVLSKIKSVFKNRLLRPSIKEEDSTYLQLGRFRLGGEVHQWMYDRYSLSKLLQKTGFKEVHLQTAFTSNISHWNSFELESKDGIIFKPDSLFIEAKK